MIKPLLLKIIIKKNMKKLFMKIIVLAGLISFVGCASSPDPATWNSEKLNDWFEKGEWLNGWTVSPDESINRKEFAFSYYKNKDRWDKTFAFLKENDLSSLEIRRHDLDGDNLFALVQEYDSKNVEDAKYEAHKNYIDIQYVAEGKELMGLVPVSEKQDVLVPYDATKDIEFMTVNKDVVYKASPERFFIFFPSDLHRPGLKDGENSPVRKIVVKLKID
jgi:biofilm protein TabA